jgi:hypothetical protein
MRLVPPAVGIKADPNQQQGGGGHEVGCGVEEQQRGNGDKSGQRAGQERADDHGRE